MNPPTSILIVGQPPKAISNELQASAPALNSEPAVRCPVVVKTSPEQAIAHAEAEHPYLVILSGEASQTEASQNIARQIRQRVQPAGVTIVAVAPSSEPSWEPKKPSAEIDGFFVEPLSADILTALNESAFLRSRY